MTKYALDADVFMQAHRMFYPFDVFPGFWRVLLKHHDEKHVFSIERVKKEINKGDDELKRWANAAPATFFKKTEDRAVIDLYREIVNWVATNPQYDDDAKSKIGRVADGWLVAYCKANGLVVVTQEAFEPLKRTDVPIPVLCQEFGVRCINTVAMLRELGVKLVLSRR